MGNNTSYKALSNGNFFADLFDELSEYTAKLCGTGGIIYWKLLYSPENELYKLVYCGKENIYSTTTKITKNSERLARIEGKFSNSQKFFVKFNRDDLTEKAKQYYFCSCSVYIEYTTFEYRLQGVFIIFKNNK